MSVVRFIAAQRTRYRVAHTLACARDTLTYGRVLAIAVRALHCARRLETDPAAERLAGLMPDA